VIRRVDKGGVKELMLPILEIETQELSPLHSSLTPLSMSQTLMFEAMIAER
jgi:hypothetical protein